MYGNTCVCIWLFNYIFISMKFNTDINVYIWYEYTNIQNVYFGIIFCISLGFAKYVFQVALINSTEVVSISSRVVFKT